MNRLNPMVWLAACCCMLAAASVVRAGEIAAPLSWAPADVDAVFVLRGAADVRTTALGVAGEEAFLGMLAGAEQTRAAWGAFAATLGWNERDAFDALLGRRFVVIARGFWSPDTPTEWALVSDIALDVDELIRQRLAGPPREVVFGLPVFALEQGRFSLLRYREGGVARIVIAPTPSMGLLKGVARQMRKPGVDSLLAAPEARRVAALGEGDALGLLRFPEGIGGWWGGVARLEAAGATATTVTTLTAPMEPPAPWSIDGWERAADGSALLLVERLMAADEAKPKGLEGVFRDIAKVVAPLLDRAGAQRAALMLSPRDAGGLDAAGAVQCADGRGAAREVDAVMQRTVAWLGAVAGDSAPGHDFGGILPESARRVRLGEADRLTPIYGAGPLEVVWRYRPDTDGGDGGWWVAGTGDAATTALTNAIEAGARGDAGGGRSWLSFGVARPATLIGEVGATGVPLPEALRGFGGFDSIEWWSWMERPDEMLGRFRIVARPRPAGF